MLFNGTSFYFACTSGGLANSLIGGTNTPFTLFIVGHFVSIPGGTTLCPFFIGSTSSNNPLWDCAINTTGGYTVFKRSTAGGADNVFRSGGTANTSRHVFSYINTSTPTIDGQVDGVSVLSGGLSVGSLTVNCIALGCAYANASPSSWANFRLARVLAFTGALGTPDITDITSVLTAMYL